MKALISAMLLLACSQARAASGAAAASFLEIPVGARPAALGGAYGALSDDAYAPIFNPAGLAELRDEQAALTHVAYLEGMSYEFLGVGFPVGAGQGFGLAVQYFRPGEVAARDASGVSAGDASGYSAAYTASYGARAGKALSFGAGLKVIDSRLDGVAARAVDGDVGARWQAAGSLIFSGALANVAGAGLTYLSQKDRLSRTARLGAAWRASSWLTVTLEGARPLEREQTDFRSGLEWRPVQLISLRGGFQTAGSSRRSGAAGLIAGAGIMVLGQEVDYAWVPFGELGNSQYLSLKVLFGGDEIK